MFPLCSILWIRLTCQYITELPRRESTFIPDPGVAKPTQPDRHLREREAGEALWASMLP